MTRRLRTASAALVALCAGCPKPKAAAEIDAGPPASATAMSTSVAPQTSTGAFEGVMEVRLEDPKHASSDELVFEIRGADVRFETPNKVRGMPAVGIFDTVQRRTTVLIPGQKSFLLLDAGAPPAEDAPWTVTKSGNHAAVAGYDCELWEAKSGARKATACVANGIPYFDVRQVAGTGGTGGWAGELRGTSSLPLRVSEYDARGQLVSRVETTKIERRTLPAAEFTIPAGYTEVTGTPGGNTALRPGLPR